MSDETDSGNKLMDFVEKMRREFPEPFAIERRCGRCNRTFTSRPDGFVDEALENGIAAHQERCFVVGDAVVATHRRGEEAEGRIAAVLTPGMFSVQISKSMGGCVAGSHLAFGASVLRRIPRPAQACGHPLPWTSNGSGYACSACGATGLELPRSTAPTLYDGCTLAELLIDDEDNRREGWVQMTKFTPLQREAISAHWSAELRRKVEAEREREANQVRIEVDAEDCEW